MVLFDVSYVVAAYFIPPPPSQFLWTFYFQLKLSRKQMWNVYMSPCVREREGRREASEVHGIKQAEVNRKCNCSSSTGYIVYVIKETQESADISFTWFYIQFPIWVLQIIISRTGSSQEVLHSLQLSEYIVSQLLMVQRYYMACQQPWAWHVPSCHLTCDDQDISCHLASSDHSMHAVVQCLWHAPSCHLACDNQDIYRH